MEKKYISYIRLSRIKKDRTSGIEYNENNSLGLDAQRLEISRHIEREPGELVHEYREIESGTPRKRHKRRQIRLAIEHAKMIGATLLIAKLDRLGRDVEFIAGLMNSKVDFICCDNPNYTRLTINILSATAEDEARGISDRVRRGLHQKKLRGEPLGWKTHENPTPKWSDEHRQLAVEERKRIRSENTMLKQAAAYAYQLSLVPAMSLRKIAQTMQESSYRSLSKKKIYPQTVKRLLQYHRDQLTNSLGSGGV